MVEYYQGKSCEYKAILQLEPKLSSSFAAIVEINFDLQGAGFVEVYFNGSVIWRERFTPILPEITTFCSTFSLTPQAWS
ncbi:hypothetical protein C2869_14280 [Saccharobesus litoralis]|uniref:Uncharacterized protein n=1 Tax=Saccharobesus litoralis TaxID=2172099 RepID=A0A2S0VTJ3_9ALTE|nr:hypothetical protein C2869_14280 [Saccharobesus litoralis]